MAYSIEPALAVRPATPVWPSAVSAYEQITGRRYGGVHRQHAQAGEQLGFCDVTGGGLRKFRAPEFASRIAGDNCVPGPPCRAECRAAVHTFVEVQSAGGLMLRPVIKNTW